MCRQSSARIRAGHGGRHFSGSNASRRNRAHRQGERPIDTPLSTTVSTSSDPTLFSNIMDLINGKIAAALSAVTAARQIVGSKASAIVTTPPDPPGAPTK